MLKTFIVYPKEGMRLLLEFETFQIIEGGFILYNDAVQPSKEGFLSFDNVAAIVPEQQANMPGMIGFHIYLKNKPQPLEIFAHSFDTEQKPSVIFYWQRENSVGTIIKEEALLGIYVALSEVVAIMPSDGLLSFRQ
ncbi:MAG: hypothetical protein M3458_20910 [Acidobacteriota bacterium]|nr:hypothetical protein [Acidobacteriota bacterium]